MSWLIWRARSPTVARRSASRTRAVLRAQPRGEVAEQPRQRADFVGAGVELDVEAIEIEHGGLLGKRGQRPADSRRHPHRQQQRGDSGPGGGQQKPGIRAAQQRPERRQRLRHLQPRLHDLERCVRRRFGSAEPGARRRRRQSS